MLARIQHKWHKWPRVSCVVINQRVLPSSCWCLDEILQLTLSQCLYKVWMAAQLCWDTLYQEGGSILVKLCPSLLKWPPVTLKHADNWWMKHICPFTYLNPVGRVDCWASPPYQTSTRKDLILKECALLRIFLRGGAARLSSWLHIGPLLHQSYRSCPR